MKVEFTGQIPHNVPGIGLVNPGQQIDVEDEKGKKLINGFFVEVKPEPVAPASGATTPTEAVKTNAEVK